MITPEQAKKEYGFRDCTEYEDNMTLGLYHASAAWFQSPFMRGLDILLPFFIAGLIFAALVGMVAFGPHPMLLLLAAGLAFAFIPQYWRQIKTRRDNSGLLFVESWYGNHFLIARGTCVKRIEEAELGMQGRRVKRSLRVKLANGKYLDDVLVIKELYDDIKEGSGVSVIMPDSDNADQIIGAPVSFTNMVIDRKKVVVQQFAEANPGSMRELDEEERAMYARQFKDRIAAWKKQYQQRYFIAMVVFFILGIALLMFGLSSGTLIMWLISVYSAIILIQQMREFRRHLDIIEKSDPLTAVDVIVQREETYKDSMGTTKRSSSSVGFRDASGTILWTLRDAESIRTFLKGEKAILIVSGKEMIPLHRNTDQYTIHS